MYIIYPIQKDTYITNKKLNGVDGKNANFWAGKGIALRFLQRYPDSLVALKKALELNPNHPQALINQDIVMQKIQPPIP